MLFVKLCKRLLEGAGRKHFMEKLNSTTKQLLDECFGKDSLIALASVQDGRPHVRTVNTFYEDGAFYVITHALSNKMQQIAANPHVAISGDWFSAHGQGINLGWFCKDENKCLATKLKKAVCAWIDNGHNDFADENTCILCVCLTDGVLFSHGTRYDMDFTD